MAWTTPTTQTTGVLITAATWNTDLVDNLNYLKTQAGMILVAQSGNLSPSDATSYYFGVPFNQAPDTNEAITRIHVPVSGTVKKIYLQVENTGTLGTSESSTLYFRLNNTTDTSITSSIQTHNTILYLNNTGLSISLAAGDYFSLKWTTPTWSTNPTNVRFNALIYIEP